MNPNSRKKSATETQRHRELAEMIGKSTNILVQFASHSLCLRVSVA